ncbi:murein biosynthesis integral membrane protein MurJ [Couchioplanes caeruleus]|uniref:murein biosynthesis integral membrane protein MurJ n=1 Tax=Couchioplanes caeruleus TaxID=56438 RepID=UPI00373FDBD7
MIPPTNAGPTGGTVYGRGSSNSGGSGSSSGTVYGSSATARTEGTAPGADPAGAPRERPAEESRSTAGNSVIMAAGSLVSRLIGFVRNMLIGMTLGKAIGDPYTSAQFLPMQVYEMLLGGVLSSVLIPLLVRRSKADPDGGELFTQRLLTLAVVALGAATALVTVAAPVITAVQSSSRAPAGYQDLVTSLSYLMLPIIFFTGLSALIGAVLNVRGHFAAPMWAPILNNLVVIATCGAFILFFGTADGLTPEEMTPGRIALIGGGTLLGMVVQAAGLVPALRKVGFTWGWRWNPRALGLGEVGGLAGWMLVYVGVNQISVFLVARVLSGIGGDGKASLLAYNNVFLLTMMAHGIIGVSVMTALLPKMSAAAAEGRYADVSADLSRGIRLTTTALAPICVVYGVLGVPISVTLFQGGALSYDQAFATGGVLAVAAFTVIPLSVSYLCTYAFYALQGNRTVALINVPVVALRIVGYLIVAEALGQSLTAAGMTGANAVSYLVSALISLTVLRRRIGRLNLGSVAAALLKVLAAAAVATAAGLLVVKVLPGGDTPERPAAALQVVIGGGVVMLAYLGAALLLKVREVHQVIGMVRRKIGR